ncbi:MAG: zinc transport system substrate-binding protein [Desulfobacteraceae bacterium Eth-SRB1]|nr:MAG: zinc transport system substrate-binding protein [Desulfobacteraceae bacterium Eth-SRB1]
MTILVKNTMDKKQAIMAAIVVPLIICAAASVYFFVGSLEEEHEDNQTIVIVTIVPQQEFVEKVGGDKVRITVMIPPGASPHTYEPTPGMMKEVTKAEMYAKVGSGVEFENNWMEKIISNNRNMNIVDCSEGITKMGNDPHIWNSPVNAKIMVENICNGLVKIDPDNADYYTQNKDNYLKELDTLNEYIHHKLDGFSNRVFMTYHPSFGYFAEEYNLTQLAVEHGGKEPTPHVIQDSIDESTRYNLKYVFVAPEFAAEPCKTIARAIGGETASMDPLARNYTSNMKQIADSLALEFEE